MGIVQEVLGGSSTQTLTAGQNPNVPASVAGTQQNCCSECYSSSLGNSNLSPNPATVDAEESIQLCKANAQRKSIYICNTGSTTIFIGLGSSPSATAYNVPLPPCVNNPNDGTGGFWVSEMWQGTIFLISDADGGTVNFTEQI